MTCLVSFTSNRVDELATGTNQDKSACSKGAEYLRRRTGRQNSRLLAFVEIRASYLSATTYGSGLARRLIGPTCAIHVAATTRVRKGYARRRSRDTNNGIAIKSAHSARAATGDGEKEGEGGKRKLHCGRKFVVLEVRFVGASVAEREAREGVRGGWSVHAQQRLSRREHTHFVDL